MFSFAPVNRIKRLNSDQAAKRRRTFLNGTDEGHLFDERVALWVADPADRWCRASIGQSFCVCDRYVLRSAFRTVNEALRWSACIDGLLQSIYHWQVHAKHAAEGKKNWTSHAALSSLSGYLLS
tara:strand:+ start:849 stop:1220 length:372 start_codon:yes stop_codon:yes gene_type:complete